jgi:hypothetical protein
MLLFYGPFLVMGLTRGFDKEVTGMLVFVSGGVGGFILIFAPFILLRWWRVGRTPLQTWGERRAIKLYRRALKKQGFDHFWTNEEYRVLAEGSASITELEEMGKRIQDLSK